MTRHLWKAAVVAVAVLGLLGEVATVDAQIRAGVRARRGRDFQPTTVRSPDIGLWMGATTDKGLTVRDTATEGAIAKVGFREGDRIVSVNGQPVTSERQFIQLLFAEDVRNQQVKVVVRREGRDVVLVVQPAMFVEEYSAAPSDPLWDYGIIVDDSYTDRIVIQRVAPRSAAYYAGLRVGDVITTVRGQRIASVADFTRALSAEGDVRLAIGVNRGNATRELEIDTAVGQGEAEGDVRTNLKPNLDDPNTGRQPREGDRPREPAPREPAPREPAPAPREPAPAPRDPAPAPRDPAPRDPAPDVKPPAEKPTTPPAAPKAPPKPTLP